MIIAGSGSTALAAVLPTCSDQQSSRTPMPSCSENRSRGNWPRARDRPAVCRLPLITPQEAGIMEQQEEVRT